MSFFDAEARILTEHPYGRTVSSPGTCVERLDPDTKWLLVGTVMDIPLSSDPTRSLAYHILLDNGSAMTIPLSNMTSLIPPPLISLP
jgi:hypothetical protein